MNNRKWYFAGLAGLLFFAVLHCPLNLAAEETLSADEIITRVDRNQYIEHGTVEVRMTVQSGTRQQIKLFTVTRDSSTVLIDFSNPHDEGTLMQYSNGRLEIFYPDSRHPVVLEGRMLNMAFMGSDFSYMDVIKPYPYGELYSFQLISTQQLDESEVYLLRGATRSNTDHTPQQLTLWIDAEQFVVLRQESGNANTTTQRTAVTEVIEYFTQHTLPARRVLQRQLQPDTYSIIEVLSVEPAE